MQTFSFGESQKCYLAYREMTLGFTFWTSRHGPSRSLNADV